MLINKNFNSTNDKANYERFRIWLISTMGLIGIGIVLSSILNSSIPFVFAIAIGIAVQFHLKTAWFMGRRLVTSSDEPYKFWFMLGLQIVVLLLFIYSIYSGHSIISF